MLRWSPQMVFVLVLMLAGSAGADVVTLASLEKRALEADGFGAEHAARARESEADLRKAAAAYYPQVSLRAESTVQPGRQLLNVCKANPGIDPSTGDARPCPDGDAYRVQGARAIGEGGTGSALFPQQAQRLEISATAPIYDFGRTKSAVAAGKASVEAVRAERDAEAESVVRSVRAAYLNWLSAHELARVTEAAARDAEDRFARVSALVDQGARPKAELPAAQSDALLTKLELTRSYGDLRDALTALEGTVGDTLPVGAEPDLSIIEGTSQGVTPYSQTTDALERVIERQRTAAHKLELSYKKQRMPQLGVSVLAGVRNQQTSFFPLYGAGLSFFVPLYDGGLSEAAAAAARAQYDALGARLRGHAREQERAHSRAERDAEQALDSLAIAEQLLAVAEKRLSDAQAGYELGVNGIDQIADARALVRRAQTEVLLSKVAHADARLRFAPVDL